MVNKKRNVVLGVLNVVSAVALFSVGAMLIVNSITFLKKKKY